VRLEFAEGTRSDEKVEVVVPLFARQHETIQPVDVE
jgi:hypothetical protein